MSKPMRVKVKYVQKHFYIINLGICRWYQAVIPILDIWIGFGVMAEKLNHYVRIFRFCGVFYVHPPPPPRQKFKIPRTLSSNVLAFKGFVNICLKWRVGQILRSLAEKRRNRTKIQGSALQRISISWCFLRKRSIMWAGQTKFPGSVWHASPTLDLDAELGIFGNSWFGRWL